jgi:hypothetical protein
VKLFNIMVHMLSDTTRHAGHADILREQLDGTVGMSAKSAALHGHDSAFWEARRATIRAGRQGSRSGERPTATTLNRTLRAATTGRGARADPALTRTCGQVSAKWPDQSDPYTRRPADNPSATCPDDPETKPPASGPGATETTSGALSHPSGKIRTATGHRRPGDPVRWPVPCGRCGQHHQIAAHWPDAGVCGYCY